MGQGDVKNPQSDQRVGNKSGNMGRSGGEGRSSNQDSSRSKSSDDSYKTQTEE